MKKYRRIRDLREDHDLTQTAVGAVINITQRSYLIPPEVLCALADFYDVSVDYLLERTDRPETNR